MESIIPDIIGTIGVALVLLSYFMLQASLLKVEQPVYSVLNTVGSVMILYSLYFHWNFASVVIEISWLFISVYGLYKARRRSTASST